MFKFLKNKINQFTTKISSIFSRSKLDEEFLNELKSLFLSADTGPETTNYIINTLKEKINNKTIINIQESKKELAKILTNILIENKEDNLPQIILLVGINGTGKTTFAAKLANKLKNENKKVLLVAADTFRAAAVEQLKTWGKKIGVEVLATQTNNDPASIVFDGCLKFKNENYDHIIIDTAGRLQNKINLMKELEKIRNVINKSLKDSSDYKISCWLTIDAMLGQNSFDQAKTFKDVTNIDGIILTKLDTMLRLEKTETKPKGGIVFSISKTLNLPIIYVTYGENLEDIRKFNSKDFIDNLLNN